MANAVPALRALVACSGLPVAATLKGLGAADDAHPGYLGMLGMHGSKAANLAVQQCDLLLAVGARFDDRVTGRLNAFAPQARVIHLDIDPAELNKLRQAHVTLCGELTPLLSALTMPLSIAPLAATRRTIKGATRLALRSPRRGHLCPLVFTPALRA